MSNAQEESKTDAEDGSKKEQDRGKNQPQKAMVIANDSDSSNENDLGGWND